MDYEEAVSRYFEDEPVPGTFPQPSEILSQLHDDGCWALANVDGFLALVDEAGYVVRPSRDN